MVKKLDILTIIVGIILSVIFFRKCGQQKKPLKAMVVNSAIGLVGLAAAAIITGFMGCGIAVNATTVVAASVLGVPGVVMILVTVFIF